MEHTKELLSIGLSALAPSPFNVRRHSVGQIEELAALIDDMRETADDYRDSEFCGACWDPTGRTLFVNMQSPGITFAITHITNMTVKKHTAIESRNASPVYLSRQK